MATTLTPGVCLTYGRIKSVDGSYRNVKRTICCNHFEERNGICVECKKGYFSKGKVCTKCVNTYGYKCIQTCNCNSKERCHHEIGCVPIGECPIGQYSKVEKCTKCESGLYGHKCSFTCKCNSTDRCDHVKGCVLIDAKTDTDDTFKNYPSAVTSREIILFVVIIFIGLMVFLGLLHVCRKRQRRILVIPLQNKEIQADNVRQHHIEERSESVYDEIDESAMSKTIALSSVRPSLHSSYLDVTDSQCYTMDTKDTDRSTATAMFSTQSEPAQKTSQRRQRHSLEKNIKEQSIQREEGNEYSDAYLRPMFLAERNWFDKMSENKGTLFSNKKKMTEKIYDKPAYDGISISVSYDRLISAKSVGNQIYEKVLVNNPIYPSDDLLDKNLKQSKCTSLASKRQTI